MAIERWGAFSVLDHKDDRRLAAEVLLYDRLLIPTPDDHDIERWRAEQWDPEGLKTKLALLGDDIVIRARWDQDSRADWARRFSDLRADQRDINAALQMTRRVLADNARNYRPTGVHQIEAIAAFQSADSFDDTAPAMIGGTQAASAVIAHRMAVPDHADAAEALKRALDLAHDDTFRHHRAAFHDWQRQALLAGQLPDDVVAEASRLVDAWNAHVARSARDIRWRRGYLVASIGAGAMGLAAGIAPGLFAAAAMGSLSGAIVAQVGAFAGGAAIQIWQHASGSATEQTPDSTLLTGAMFHSLDEFARKTAGQATPRPAAKSLR